MLKEFKNINGEGVSAKIEVFKDGEGGKPTGEFRVCCGNDKLMERFNVNLDTNSFRENMSALEQSGKTVVCLAINNIPRVLISLEEKHLAKEEAKPVLDYMRTKMGLKVAMITGDNKHTALRVAKYLSIPEENVTYRAYPNDKKKVVMKLQAQGEKVMFVGDGVNDSPVLAQAEVGVAINSVADITVQAAGIVVMKDRLDDVLNSILISKATFRRIKYNFGWAFVYNIVLIPVAMGIFFPLKYEKKGMEIGF